MATNNINVRIDAKLKQDAERLFNELGLNMTTAINIFLRQTVRNQAIPFQITTNHQPNKETLEAMQEADRMAYAPNVKTFDSIDELLKDLNDDL